MAIKPILFNKQISTEMVRAILDGRKTCTRRLVKPQPDEKHTFPLGFVTDSTEKKEVGCFGFGINEYGGSIQYAKSRYQPGDILYVRETWCGLPVNEAGHMRGHTIYYYKADGELRPKGWRGTWHPPRYMPKEAARIWLKVTDVRMERLQDIDEDGVWDEGFRFKPPCLTRVSADGHTCDLDGPCTSSIKYCDMTMGELFGRELWNSTIKKANLDKYGWDANPWVWVIEFERCEKTAESPYAWNDAIHKLTKGV